MLRPSNLILWLIFFAIVAAAIALLKTRPAAAATQTITIFPTADAYVDKSSPTDNQGTSTSLRVDNSPVIRSYLRFTVTGLKSSPVTKAVIKFYANSSLSAGFAVNALSNNTWTESSIDYSNAPAPGTALAKSGSVSSGQWISIDITSYILGDTSYNLVLLPLSSTQLNLASREAGSHAPQLVVTYTTSGVTPSATTKPTRTKTPTLKGTTTITPNSSATPGPTATPAAKTATAATTITPTAGSGSGAIPSFDHIAVIVFENKEYSSIIGKSSLPNFNNLAKANALLTQSYAIRHPSLPNYIALTSGSTQGITSDCTSCYLSVTNLADSIEASGRSWKAYMESMPSPCHVGSSGLYTQKHNPFIYYNNIRQTGSRCKADVVPLTQLDADISNNTLPNFVWISPNLCNDSHDCSLATADKFLGAIVSKITSSSAFGANSLIIVTFDEGTTSANGGGHIVTILISPQVQPGYQDGTTYSGYSILKTIEKAWGLPYLGQTANDSVPLIAAPWK
jgi:hypothetical protein